MVEKKVYDVENFVIYISHLHTKESEADAVVLLEDSTGTKVLASSVAEAVESYEVATQNEMDTEWEESLKSQDKKVG